MAHSAVMEGRGEGEEEVDVVDAKRKEVVEVQDPANLGFYTKLASSLGVFKPLDLMI